MCPCPHRNPPGPHSTSPHHTSTAAPLLQEQHILQRHRLCWDNNKCHLLSAAPTRSTSFQPGYQGLQLQGCGRISGWIPTDTVPAGGRGLGKKTTHQTPSNSMGFLQALTCQAGLLWYCSLSKHLHLFHKFNPSLSAIRRKCRSFSD